LFVMRRGVFVALVVITALAFGAVAGAAGGNDPRSQLLAQIGAESQAEIAALNNLKAIQDKRAAIDARVGELDRQVNAAQATLANLTGDADRLAGVLQSIEARVAVTQAKLDAAMRAFHASAAQQYRSARSGANYSGVFATPPEDLVIQDKYLAHVSQRRHQLVRHVSVLRHDLEQRRRAAHDEKVKADTAAAGARTARDQVAALRAQIEPARADAAQQQATEATALADIQARLGTDEAELAALQAASDSISAKLRAHPRPGQVGRCDARPVPGAITSGFGPRRDPIRGGSGFHPGVDMHAGYGEPISACRAGIVVTAGPQGGYGNVVVIDHGGGMATLYAHQSRIAVTVGQQVNAGQIIGYIGSTGYSTGPHLHFEVRIDGNPVDPAPYL